MGLTITRKLLSILVLCICLFMAGQVRAQTVSQISYGDIQKIFSAGRSLGSAYYYLVDLASKSPSTPYADLKDEYNQAFQSLNISDLITDDLGMNSESQKLLRAVRLNLYNALNKQCIIESQLSSTLDTFTRYYEDLILLVNSKYGNQGSWFLNLGFYSAFQLDSINSPNESKLILSGIDKIVETVPVSVPEPIKTAINNIKRLDQAELTGNDLIALKNNVTSIIEFFSNYPDSRDLITELKDLSGKWQGILINPNCIKHNIRLIVNNDQSAVMEIEGIAKDIHISNVEIVNNYFSFMFKPFNTEKLYIRFNAKLSDSVFTGEVLDVLNERGYWVLAKVDENNQINEENLNTMTSYIKEIEAKYTKLNLKEVIPVNNSEEKTSISPNHQPEIKEKILIDINNK